MAVGAHPYEKQYAIGKVDDIWDDKSAENADDHTDDIGCFEGIDIGNVYSYEHDVNDDPYEKYESGKEIASVPPSTVPCIVESAH